MGRKIPGRKHRGVKDPEKQQAERFEKIKDKINAPPVNPDEQQVPKSLMKFMDLKEKAKNWKPKKKSRSNKSKNKLKKCFTTHLHSPYDKPMPELTQYPGETDKEFLNRVNTLCENVKKEVAFEGKYKVQVKRDLDTGEVEDVVKRPKDELEILISEARKKQKMSKKKNKHKGSNEEKLTKSQKKQIKLREKKQKKVDLALQDRKEVVKDVVMFGETVHAPPELVAPKKIMNDNSIPRPGRRELLLKSMLGMKEDKILQNEEKPKSSLNKISKKAIDKKGKRKDLPAALRRQLDQQQSDVILAYKKMKSHSKNMKR